MGDLYQLVKEVKGVPCDRFAFFIYFGMEVTPTIIGITVGIVLYELVEGVVVALVIL